MGIVDPQQTAKAALIVLDDDVPRRRLLGLSWPEFRVREAMGAGAAHIVLAVTRVTPTVVAAVDHARAKGASATLARSAADVADLFHPDEAVLLFSGDAVVERSTIDALFAAPGPALVCVAPDAGEDWELIDARARWTGLARIDGAMVRATAEMVGDWDLASMLLRRAVAAKAKRLALPRLPLLASDDSVPEALARRMVLASTLPARGWGEAWILQPLTGFIAQAAHRALPSVAAVSLWGALAIWVGAAFGGLFLPPIAACALILIAFIVSGIAMMGAAVLNPEARKTRRLAIAADVSTVLALFGIARPVSADLLPIALSAVLVAVMLLMRRISPEIMRPRWLADAPGHTVIIAIGSLFGPVGMVAALAICTSHGLLSLGWLQDKLSRALTSPR